MKQTKRATKILEILENIEWTVHYFTGGQDLHKQDFKKIREYIEEISASKRLTEIKVAAKIKKAAEEEE